jgi:hypothetical protein
MPSNCIFHESCNFQRDGVFDVRRNFIETIESEEPSPDTSSSAKCSWKHLLLDFSSQAMR